VKSKQNVTNPASLATHAKNLLAVAALAHKCCVDHRALGNQLAEVGEKLMICELELQGLLFPWEVHGTSFEDNADAVWAEFRVKPLNADSTRDGYLLVSVDGEVYWNDINAEGLEG
jgi:hypothetical protein